MNAVVRSFFAALSLLAVSSFTASLHAQVTATAPVVEQAQYTNRWDIFGGVGYAHFNPSPSRNVEANNLLGWNGTGTVYFRPIWGIEASARGGYGTINLPANQFGVTTSKMSQHLFLFGPTFRLYRRPKYAASFHTLIGAAYGSFDSGFPPGVQPNQLGVYNNKLAFGAAVGADGDYNLTPRFAVRIVADWQPTRYGFTVQNEFAGSVGIVYKLGSLQK